MVDDGAIRTIPCYTFPAIMDAIQRAVIDRHASKGTRKAAFSALLALIEAGLITGDTSPTSTLNDENKLARTAVSEASRLTG